MTSRWQWLVRLLFRRIWFRAALFSIFSVGLALLAAFVAPFVPYDISTKIGSDAVDNILGILASSRREADIRAITATGHQPRTSIASDVLAVTMPYVGAAMLAWRRDGESAASCRA